MTVPDPILLIDDHDDGRGLMEELLQLNGYRVVAARNGDEALALVNALRPCIIFIDLGLPDISGIVLALQIRSLPAGADTPMYALSGLSRLRAQAMAAGCDDFILKPVLPGELRQLVARHCRQDPDVAKVA